MSISISHSQHRHRGGGGGGGFIRLTTQQTEVDRGDDSGQQVSYSESKNTCHHKRCLTDVPGSFLSPLLGKFLSLL